jgi:uncharacterized protein (DUF58 family)
LTLPVPTARLALVAAVAAVVLFVAGSVGVWLALLGALAVVALLDLALAVSPTRIEVARQLPSAAVAGGRVDLQWVIEDRGGRTTRISVGDQLAPSLRPGRRRFRARLRPGVEHVESTELRPSRRGRFELPDLVVRTEGPLGLLARQRRRPCPGRLQVQPPFPSRDAAELRVRRFRRTESGLRTAQGRGGGTEFDQLREYTPDDESRRMDWAATARTGKPIVRTYRAEQNQVVVTLLDNGRVMAGQVAGIARVEHAMDAAMALTNVAGRLGDRAGLVVFDVGVRSVLPPRTGAGQVGRLAETFSGLDPVLLESDYAGAFSATVARFRRRALLVVLTDLVEQAALATLEPALPLLASRHRVVVAAVRDPAVSGWAAEAPADVDAAFRSAAAVDALEERRRTAARLRGLGATVLDADPGDLGPRLCDLYLDVKATGAL